MLKVERKWGRRSVSVVCRGVLLRQLADDIQRSSAPQLQGPDASAEGGDVEVGVVLGVKYHAVAPFEIVARELFPGETAVGGAPGGLLETGGVEDARVLGIDRDIVDVLVFGKDATPRGAGIRGEIN